MIKILLADDHALMRKGLELILAEAEDLNLLGTAENGEQCLEIARHHPADILLLDLEMPGMNGLTTLRKLRLKHPGLRVIILSMHPEEIYGQTARQLGAQGYVSKLQDPETLIEAIRKVYYGHTHFLPGSQNENGSKKAVHLSQREIEVLRLLTTGLSNKGISEELKISDKTVSTYKNRLFHKIGAHTVVDLIRFAQNYPDILQGKKAR